MPGVTQLMGSKARMQNSASPKRPCLRARAAWPRAWVVPRHGEACVPGRRVAAKARILSGARKRPEQPDGQKLSPEARQGPCGVWELLAGPRPSPEPLESLCRG